MQSFYREIDSLERVDELLRFAATVCNHNEVMRYNYHMTPPLDASNSMRTQVIAEGFSEDWLELYGNVEFRQADPIPGRTLRYGGLLPWTEAMALGQNSRENQLFFRAMHDHDLIHGFGVPLYGPRGRNAYASFDFGVPPNEVDPASIWTVRSVAQAAHQRISSLIDQQINSPQLSNREREVLIWIANGKSISAIGAILGLSPETIKTYLKRLYAKLGVNNRLGATIKGIRLELVEVDY